MNRTRCFIAVTLFVVLVVGQSFEGLAQGQRSSEADFFLEPLLYASIANIVTGVGLLSISGHIETLVNDPDQWCNPDAELQQFRSRYEILMPSFGSAVVISMGVLAGIDRGDWGFAMMFGILSSPVTSRYACSLNTLFQDEFLKIGSILVVPAVISAMFSIQGFMTHAR